MACRTCLCYLQLITLLWPLVKRISPGNSSLKSQNPLLVCINFSLIQESTLSFLGLGLMRDFPCVYSYKTILFLHTVCTKPLPGWHNKLDASWSCCFYVYVINVLYCIFFVFYIVCIIVWYCIRPSIVLFSYSAYGCKIVLLNQSVIRMHS